MLEIYEDTKENKEISEKSYIEVTELPSAFKCYPKGTKVYYSPLTLKELTVLNNGTINSLDALALLLNNIRTEKISTEELSYVDVMYIGIRRKLLAFGDIKASLVGQCSKCGHIDTYDLSYTDIEFNQLDIEHPYAVIDIQGTEVKFGVLTIKDFLELDENGDVLSVYARMVKNLPYEEAYKLVGNATGQEIIKLQKIEKLFNFGIAPIKAKCKGIIPATEDEPEHVCGNEIEMEVTSPFDVVFPSDITSSVDDVEIRFSDI